MKTLAVMALVAGVTMSVYGQALLTDIVTYEAIVVDDASGQSLASAGPWAWEDLVPQELTGDIGGAGKSVAVKCRNAAGQTIFGGTIVGLDLTVPFLPFDPAPYSGPVSLLFVPESYTVSIFLNGQFYLGELLMLPAEDDPVGPVIQTVSIDIKPGSSTNPFNIKSEGRLPVAILGSADLDVSLIDQASIKLATIAPLRFAITDVQRDGYKDLVLLFQDKAVAALVPDGVDGEVVGLELTGMLNDGTLITGTDTITLKVPKPKKPCKKDNDWDNDRDGKKSDKKDCGKDRR